MHQEVLCEEVPPKHLEDSLVYMISPCSPLTTRDLVCTKPLFWPVEALDFGALSEYCFACGSLLCVHLKG